MVAPHPVNDNATISIERWNSSPLTYMITDINGVEMQRGVISELASTWTWDRKDAAAHHLSAGPYALTVTDGETVRRRLLIVE